MELLISVIKLWIWQKFNYKEDPAWYPESLATRACWRQGFFARAPSRNLDMEQSRAAWNSVRERLNTSPPKDNDDILENHISDQQETLEVKVTAPILARLHFLTINVFGSCQNWEQSGAAGCRIRKGDPNLELFSDRVILGLKRRREMSAGENGSKLLLPSVLLMSFFPHRPAKPSIFQEKREFGEIV